MGKDKFFILNQKAVPDVLLKVVEVNRLLETDKTLTVQEATDSVDISRSSFYKYKDYILPFSDNARGRTITFMLQVKDTPGLLSTMLNSLAEYEFNILTIHQSVPVNNLATITLSVEVPKDFGDVSEALKTIEELEGIYYLKILARE